MRNAHSPGARARRDTRHIPIVVVSGTDTSDLNPADSAAVLQKPVDANMLIDAIDGAIRLRRDLAPPGPPRLNLPDSPTGSVLVNNAFPNWLNAEELLAVVETCLRERP